MSDQTGTLLFGTLLIIALVALIKPMAKWITEWVVNQ